MNKKTRNRKLVSQTNRNRMRNRHYNSTIKTLFKVFFKQMKDFTNQEDWNFSQKTSSEIFFIRNKLYSAIDKAVKKGVIHKNTAARKKSGLHLIYKRINQTNQD
jgi:small subunit ribosomal protein S20